MDEKLRYRGLTSAPVEELGSGGGSREPGQPNAQPHHWELLQTPALCTCLPLAMSPLKDKMASPSSLRPGAQDMVVAQLMYELRAVDWGRLDPWPWG